MKQPTNIMIHHTAVSHSVNPDQFNATNEYHKAKWNFKSSLGFYGGYHEEISAVGTLKAFRVAGEVSAACIDHNDGSTFHIVLDGNFDIEKPTPPQIYKLRDRLRELAKEFGISTDEIFLHRDFWATACPGIYIDRIFIRSLVAPEVIEKEIKNPQEEILHEIVVKHGELGDLIKKLYIE